MKKPNRHTQRNGDLQATELSRVVGGLGLNLPDHTAPGLWYESDPNTSPGGPGVINPFSSDWTEYDNNGGLQGGLSYGDGYTSPSQNYNNVDEFIGWDI